MTIGGLVKAAVILIALALIAGTIRSLAKRVMTDSFSLMWIMVSVGLLIGCIVISATQWNQVLNIPGMDIAVGFGVCVLLLLYYLSIQISLLQRKNQELAMRLSLLTQENEEILKKLDNI